VGTDGWTSLPLSAVTFEPDLDLTNGAPGGQVYRLRVRLQRQPGGGAHHRATDHRRGVL
jgi:hypothetical protein